MLLAKAAKEPRKQDGLWMVGGRHDGQSDDDFSELAERQRAISTMITTPLRTFPVRKSFSFTGSVNSLRVKTLPYNPQEANAD